MYLVNFSLWLIFALGIINNKNNGDIINIIYIKLLYNVCCKLLSKRGRIFSEFTFVNENIIDIASKIMNIKKHIKLVLVSVLIPFLDT